MQAPETVLVLNDRVVAHICFCNLTASCHSTGIIVAITPCQIGPKTPPKTGDTDFPRNLKLENNTYLVLCSDGNFYFT